MGKVLKYFIYAVISFGWCSILRAHYVVDCMILDDSRKLIRQYPGEICLFLSDGSFIATFKDIGIPSPDTKGRVDRIGPDGSVLWSKPHFTHHQLNLSVNQKELLVMATEFVKNDPAPLWADVLLVLDLQKGKTLKKKIIGDNPKQFLKDNRYSRLNCRTYNDKDLRIPFCEISHINAFMEIGPNKNSSNVSFLNEGNYLITDANPANVHVLDKNLSKIIWSKSFRPKSFGLIHDGQVLQDGTILFYNNQGPFPDYGIESLKRSAEMNFYDPVLNQIVRTEKIDSKWPKAFTLSFGKFGLDFIIRNKSEYQIYSPDMGGVQDLGEALLYNVNSPVDGGYAMEINHAIGGKQWIWNFPFNYKKGIPGAFLQIKKINLDQFLKNNKL